jgi:Protein of unknown function (DUF3262)
MLTLTQFCGVPWGGLRALRGVLLLLLWPTLVWAALVTAVQVADAIRNSPTANAFMREHADEIGALAIRVESGGNTTAYNGSCCYGILQLNTANIHQLGLTTEQYRAAPLQTQINGWAQVESDALKDPVIQSLQAQNSFDGQPVDASMLLACVQLGQGNCARMVKSGRCDGFKDSNGTTICTMAAKMRGAASPSPNPNPGAGSGGGAGGETGSTGGVSGSGGLGSVNTSVEPSPSLSGAEAFERGAGASMANTSQTIKLIAAALMTLLLAWSASGLWERFASGQIQASTLLKTLLQAMVLLMVVMTLLSA